MRRLAGSLDGTENSVPDQATDGADQIPIWQKTKMAGAVGTEYPRFGDKTRFPALFGYGEGERQLCNARRVESQIGLCAFDFKEAEISLPELPYKPINQCLTGLMFEQCKLMQAEGL